MVLLEKGISRKITSANYITSVNGMVHPDRTMPEHDFLYMLDGSWEIIENDKIYKIVSDDLLILPAGRHHWGTNLCTRQNRHMYFHVQPSLTEELNHTLMEKMEPTTDMDSNIDSNMDSIQTLLCPSLLHCQERPRIRWYFHELISAFWSSGSEKENRLSFLFNLMLCELAELSGECEQNDCAVSDPLVTQICREIHSTPHVFYTAEQMASRHFISARTLNNRFLKVCGKTFYTYQKETKLEGVRHFLIHQPNATLHETALNFGFYDEFHLSKAFKKQFGQSPSQFRAGTTQMP